MSTLYNFFNPKIKSLTKAKSFTSTSQFTPVKQAIASQIPNVSIPPAFYAHLLVRLCDALDIKLAKIMVWGWRKRQEIIQYRDKENPSEGFHEVDLLEHTLISKHAPVIQPVINNVPLKKFKFDVVLALKLNGITLNIRDNMIMMATTGDCIGSGSVEFDGVRIFKKETGPYKLPGTLPFEPGIPI